MIMQQEQAIIKGRRQFEDMAKRVDQAAREGMSIDVVERELCPVCWSWDV